MLEIVIAFKFNGRNVGDMGFALPAERRAIFDTCTLPGTSRLVYEGALVFPESELGGFRDGIPFARAESGGPCVIHRFLRGNAFPSRAFEISHMICLF